jgi:hypothetical protein
VPAAVSRALRDPRQLHAVLNVQHCWYMLCNML